MSNEGRDEELAKYGAAIEKVLPVNDRDKLFETAVEAGYLIALADTTADDEERKAIDDALFGISKGLVIDWEVDALVNRACEHIGAEGHVARAQAVGETLQALGQAEAGLYIAALVALASGGLDKREVEVLKRIGAAAGLSSDEVAAAVKKARANAG
jgi:tellurite resistance protein